MGVKFLRFSLFRGSTKRHALFRALVIASVLSVVSLMEIMPRTELAAKNHFIGDNSVMDLSNLGQLLLSIPNLLTESFRGNYEWEKCPEVVISDIVADLMGLKLLNYDSKVLCTGLRSDMAVSVFKEMGISNAYGVPAHPLFALMGRKHAYELAFPDKSFDFVYYGEIDQVIVPALIVLEMERVVKPGGIGAILVSSLYSNSLVKSATSISSLLKVSEILHVNSMDGFTVVVFKKNMMEKQLLPSDCQSVVNLKPYIGLMEPLVEQKPDDFPKSVTYLPKFLDLSLKKRRVYINIGAADHLNANLSSSNWFLPSYPIESKDFNVYLVDHDTSIMLSYVKQPGVTFVYYPGLAGNNATAKNMTLLEDLEPIPEDESFNFVAWFEETVKYADFAVLKINSSEVELEFLSRLVETGAICYVDEVFLQCSNKPNCIKLVQALRTRGRFVHQWWED